MTPRSTCVPSLQVLKDSSDLATAVGTGLDKCPKQLPFTLLYDELGSAIFEAITKLPEYALTAAEERLYRRHAVTIAHAAPFETLIELGSGTGAKTRILLDAFLRRNAAFQYCAIDASPFALQSCKESLRGVPGLSVETECGDFLPALSEARSRKHGPALVVFGGSSIGNFEDLAAIQFLVALRQELRDGDMLLLGTDLVNAQPAMLRAYNDSIGLTSAFCKNVLSRINRELGGNFDLNEFRFGAHWCEARSRMEMRLQSLSTQRIVVPGASVCKVLQAGEFIVAEISRKFQTGEINSMLAQAGFTLEQQWLDDEWGFAETLASVSDSPMGLGEAAQTNALSLSTVESASSA